MSGLYFKGLRRFRDNTAAAVSKMKPAKNDLFEALYQINLEVLFWMSHMCLAESKGSKLLPCNTVYDEASEETRFHWKIPPV